ncbi:hypothetical protein IQ62_20680 [Streptomyces scabiei]|uniref:hypothetical protein n=1 Tax=Streptomyces scabiei TaxID=1930 RepID=UPI0004E6F9AF|nr:hypothetical protein [Streptomyces scabiei]KFF99111.1 hypothetical protein IQ62_20680 [Streptomyces scabiei]
MYVAVQPQRVSNSRCHTSLIVQLRLARTLAAQGDRGERRAVLRALAAAEKHLGDAGADRPAWCAWVSEGEGMLPPARDKTRGVFLAYRAASYLDLKEPEPAAAAATESLLLARRIGAPRCVQLVDDLLPRFQHYQDAQGVPELLQLAAA